MADEDDVEAALVETLVEAQMATVGDPGLSTLQESGQRSSFEDADLCVFLHVVIPDMFV